jgi:protease-4
VAKFLLGVVVGAVVAAVIAVIALFAIAALRSKPAEVAEGSTLVLHLGGELPERAPVEFPLEAFGQKTPITVQDVWSLLRKAAVDNRIKAVVLEPQGLGVGWGKMQELHHDLEQFRKSGKPVYAYLKSPGTREYYIATAASKIYIAPNDMLDLKGVRFELMYFKDTLDKLGVTVDVEHAGKYKDYGDMFTRTNMSPETRQVLSSIIDRIYGDLIKTIGVSRKKSANEIEDAINNGPLLSPQIAARGLVDGLCYEDEMYGKLKTELKDEVRKVSERDYIHGDKTDSLLSGKQHIGFVVAQGEILRGDAESNDSTTNIESESFTKLLDQVANKSDLKGVIIRIDSPGGEVFASDAIWHSMNQLAHKKPVIISMSDTAASGGYYMAMNGSPIVAYQGTLTGSIGVVFGKPNLHGLYDKLGITKDTLSRGKFATIDSDYTPLAPAERDKLREGIDENYKTFLQKVAASRKRPVDQIEQVAQGRVWLGDQAKDNGLVDEIGGIDRAIEMVKQKASIPAGETVSLVIYPARRSWLEMLFSQSNEASVESQAMALLPVSLRAARVRAWLHGGFLSVSPWSLSFH